MEASYGWFIYCNFAGIESVVAENDMGRVIGKQGRIANAIRVVMRAAANRKNETVSVEID